MQNSTLALLLGAALLLSIGAIIWLAIVNRRTLKLKSHFGEEYENTVERSGSRTKAEADLIAREKRVSQFDIRRLTAQERERFILDWREVKALFVDSPNEAVFRADRLLETIMSARGYPMGDFDRRADDLTVEHAEVVSHYRTAHAIALRERGTDVSTEDLRQALIHYEALFDVLVNEPIDASAPPASLREPVRYN